ncbi:MAG: hypothetical protein A2283_05720 [Lentisphaerae bacterium RIFOXYA12_FULL_48_11]|nr:MAG: hypothetical protein A2283_05720 [Lentisphaerae bacterium RIFOXYA12_FULL_48_11]
MFLIKLVMAGVIMFTTFEVALALMCRMGRLDISKPSYRFGNVNSRFWIETNPDFGVWHGPNSSYRHITPSYDVFYKANSYGARDKERSKESNGKKRVIVVGDSFTEGYGVEDGKRFTDLLESRSGIEHLNFGTAGSFGPTQYYLLYKTLARQFEHDAVMVCILPFNDFLDDDYEYGKIAYSTHYRPFFTGQYPDYKLTYSMKDPPRERSKFLESFLREFTFTGNFIKRVKGLARHHQASMKKGYAGYYDYTKEQWLRLNYVLGQIRREAAGKEVIVVTIPAISDLERLQTDPASTLPVDLASFCIAENMIYLDLLPGIRSAPEGYRACYYKLDPHWNALGSRLAADYILKNVKWYQNTTGSAQGTNSVTSAISILPQKP